MNLQTDMTKLIVFFFFFCNFANAPKKTIQDVSRFVDITAGGECLGLCDKKVHINMCPNLDGYGVMTA